MRHLILFRPRSLLQRLLAWLISPSRPVMYCPRCGNPRGDMFDYAQVPFGTEVVCSGPFLVVVGKPETTICMKWHPRWRA